MSVRVVTQIRAEYTSARTICSNLERRFRCAASTPPPSLPAEVDFVTTDDRSHTIRVRDYDIRFLDRVDSEDAVAWLNLVVRARGGDALAKAALMDRTLSLLSSLEARFAEAGLVEDDLVVPYTTGASFGAETISKKGENLLALSRRGLPIADFAVLSAGVLALPATERHSCARAAVHDLEVLSGRRLGDAANPLLVALRSAMPAYLPGFMPTYLNVGYTPEMFAGLVGRYGAAAAARIRLNSRKTLLEALDPDAFAAMEPVLRSNLAEVESHRMADEVERALATRAPELLHDPDAQVCFLVDRIRAFYDDHVDTLRSFAGGRTQWPAVIVQRMVCSVIDEDSCAGVLFSRHPLTGTGACIQYGRAVFGEDLMTGRLVPDEVALAGREDARAAFPAVHHSWSRLAELEQFFRAPVVVEFTAVHGTFTLLQADPAEMSGPGMLAAAVALYEEGRISAARVRELVRPHHLRQVESETIDPGSLARLHHFSRAVPVLPRSAVTGRVVFSADGLRSARERWKGDRLVLVQSRFTPADALVFGEADGICSVSPAAIHVVTHAQAHGVPALLNLEAQGVKVDDCTGRMTNAAGDVLNEGDWVTISSRNRILYSGRAVYVPARLLRFVAGQDIPLGPGERATFEALAATWHTYRHIIERAGAAAFRSLEDLGQAMRHGRLRDDPGRAAELVNACFDADPHEMVTRLLGTTLGNHLVHRTAFRALTPDRRLALLRLALSMSVTRGHMGFAAGAFVLGSLVPEATSVGFWRSLSPAEVARLVAEWLLHQKYLALMDELGERRIARARSRILENGLGRIVLDPARVWDLLPLKLARHDLDTIREALSGEMDPQAAEVVDLLRRPYAAFYDPSQPWSQSAFARLCAAQGVSAPGPEEA
jgi:hypothetical protein